jgi:hypothetical protein
LLWQQRKLASHLSLFVSLLFSSIGGVFLVVGKRTYSTVYVVCGALLFVVSYLIDNALALTAVGLLITAVPWAVRRGWV